MLRLRRPRLTYANVVSTLCLMLLAGFGTAHAAGVAANSVGSLQLRNGQVARVDLRPNAVDGSRLAPNALTGADVREGTLLGVNAARVNGFDVRRLRATVARGQRATVVRFPGRFSLTLGCNSPATPGGRVLEVVSDAGGLIVQFLGGDMDGNYKSDHVYLEDGEKTRLDVTTAGNAQLLDVMVVTPAGWTASLSIATDTQADDFGDLARCLVRGVATVG